MDEHDEDLYVLCGESDMLMAAVDNLKFVICLQHAGFVDKARCLLCGQLNYCFR